MVSLRGRLLASYLFLLIFTLGGIVIALFVATGSQPAPPDATFRQLAPLIAQLEDPEFSLPDASVPTTGLPGVNPPNSENSVQFDFRTSLIQDENIRVIEMRTAEVALRVNNRRGIITYDSIGQTRPTDQLSMTLNLQNFQLDTPLVIPIPGRRFIFGAFQEGEVEWLFAGIEPDPEMTQSAPPFAVTDERLPRIRLVAIVRPTQSLQTVLADVGSSLVRPLLQASFIGVIIAVALSVLISRTIASPLQAASKAATAVARGDLDQTVPVTGPKEVRSVARAFNRMSAEVRSTQQAQRDFLANVSHDLKTPLTSIQGYSQAIMDGAAKEPQKAAEIIYDEAARLTRMVTDLTDLARLEAGQLTLHKEEIDIGYIATMVARKLEVVAKGKSIRLEARTAPMPVIMGDGDRMVQVFTNLLSNALKYTQAGGRVTIQTQSLQGGVQVRVKDTGIGIPKDDLPRIFERFYQVDKARGPRRGTGLGLAIVNEIVQLHNGRIEVDSVEGRGTIFTVWFPCQAQDTSDKVPA